MLSQDPDLEWKTRSEESVVRTPWFQVGRADVELPGGRRIDHYLFRLPPVVLTTQRGEPGYETVRMEWFALGDLPAMIASGEIRAASTTAAVLMIGNANRP